MIGKIKTIVLSRLKKENQEEWVEERREECIKCEYNSKNSEKISVEKRILMFLSNLYSTITFNKKKDNLGNCLACESCSVYYKIMEPLESCPEDKWDYIEEN